VGVYRKLAARIFPLELSASPSLASALIGRLIASDSFKEQSHLNGRVASTIPYSHLILSSPCHRVYVCCVFVCLTNWPLHKYLVLHMFLAFLRKQDKSWQLQDMPQGRERGKAEITF